MEIRFGRDKETKNTVRFAELADIPKVGMLYLQKSADADLGHPPEISVTIAAAPALAKAA